MDSNDKSLIYDKIINGYHVYHWDDGTYEAYDNDNNKVYEVKKSADDVLLFKTTSKNGKSFSMKLGDEHPFSPYDVKNDGVIISKAGKEAYFSDNVVTKLAYQDSLGNYCEFVYNDDAKVENIYDQKGGNIISSIFYDQDGNKAYEKNYVNNRITYFNDDDIYCYEDVNGVKNYANGEEWNLIIYPDGTYNDDGEEGTYVIDDNGNIICTDKENNKTIYSQYGIKSRLITKDGTVYDYTSEAQIKEINGTKTVSRINHIEYDEESYDKILRLLNEIKDTNLEKFNYSLTDIENNINNFPDKYLTSNIKLIKNNVIDHMDLVESLEKMTNYSLLAYQTCDDSLKEGLELLVDSLFGERNPGLAASFKGMIQNTIRERNGILEYKEGTNFYALSKGAIAKSVYTDSDGNKWYLSNNNTVVGLEGNNFKINYNDETFYLTYDENGVIKLVDTKGNSLNIFGDYNLESMQFGSNQMELKNSYNNPYVNDVLLKYFDGATMEEKVDILTKTTNHGCGYAAVTNLVFKEFEGKEDEFYKAYGFPMYEIKKNYYGDGFTVDYNYEPVIADLFCEVNSNSGQYNIAETSSNSIGVHRKEISKIYEYLKTSKGITLGSSIDAKDIITDCGDYSLFRMDGTQTCSSNKKTGHMMIVTDRLDDGTIYVSSWGEKFSYEKSENDDYINTFSNIWKDVLSHD